MENAFFLQKNWALEEWDILLIQWTNLFWTPVETAIIEDGKVHVKYTANVLMFFNLDGKW